MCCWIENPAFFLPPDACCCAFFSQKIKDASVNCWTVKPTGQDWIYQSRDNKNELLIESTFAIIQRSRARKRPNNLQTEARPFSNVVVELLKE